MVHRRPTDGQLGVLTNEVGARVRVVSAAPGSGKTWLVGEVIRTELAGWKNRGGLAALSFTNVARDAIAEALGGRPPSHPHFVGTLDSFIYRYVLRSFGPSIDANLGRVKLVPAEVADHMGAKWGKDALTIKIENRRVGLFEIHLRRLDGAELQLSYKTAMMSKARPVPPTERAYALGQKRNLWKNNGIASHSDLAYLAWTLVTHRDHGSIICKLLAERFPLVLVDEVQDTGWFLGEVICRLLEQPGVRGLIVGDRDQAIYEFGGARPADLDRFEQLPGAVRFPMRESLRCPKAVCRVGSLLSWQQEIVEHRSEAEDGRVVLYVFDDLPDVKKLCAEIEREADSAPVTVLVRRRSTLDTLLGGRHAVPAFGSRTLRHLWNGCRHLRAGEPAKALRAASAALCVCLFGVETIPTVGPDDEAIGEEVRRIAISALIRAVTLPPEHDVYNWGVDVLGILRDLLGALAEDKPVSTMLRKPNKKKTQGVEVRDFLGPGPGALDRRYTTVHAAKGETHELTLLVVPKPKQQRRCPSRTWFDTDEASADEEKRIAFVAATRPRAAFVLCIHRSTYEGLRLAAPEFVELFEFHEC